MEMQSRGWNQGKMNHQYLAQRDAIESVIEITTLVH